MSSGSDSAKEIPDLGDDRFEIIERIGAGGMGTVYRAIQKSVGRPVAIKVLAPEQASSASGVTRFVREANVISRLAHPNIVSVIDFGRDKQGRILMVMELLEGETLRQTIRRSRRVPISRAVAITSQILAALRVAHQSGIVHRDLKPENVFMCRVDGADLVKVLDFGVAKLVVNEGDNQTTAGSLIGTLKYMAPEQIAGDPPDPRVDLYATGVVLYEMLSGGLPYEHKEKFTLLRSILNDPPVQIRERAPDLPEALCTVLMRAVAKMPSDRYQTADELRAALAPFAQMNFAAALVPGEIPAPRQGALHDPALDLSTRAEARRPPSAAMAAAQSIEALPRANDSSSGRGEFTTGAGLSASSRANRSTSRPSTRYIAVATIGTLCLLGSVGLVMRRKSGDSTATTLSARAPAVNPAPISPVAPTAVRATMVLVRTEPPGATVIDTDTSEPLCTGTPCAVAVPAGLSRRITLRNGELSVQTLLESSLAPVFLDLRSTGPLPAAPVGNPVNATPTPGTPDSGSVPRRAHHSRANRSNHGVQMFAPRGNAGVPMFAPPAH